MLCTNIFSKCSQFRQAKLNSLSSRKPSGNKGQMRVNRTLRANVSLPNPSSFLKGARWPRENNSRRVDFRRETSSLIKISHDLPPATFLLMPLIPRRQTKKMQNLVKKGLKTQTSNHSKPSKSRMKTWSLRKRWRVKIIPSMPNDQGKLQEIAKIYSILRRLKNEKKIKVQKVKITSSLRSLSKIKKLETYQLYSK